MQIIHDFYKSLYGAVERHKTRDWYTALPSLTEEQRTSISGPLTCKEMQQALFKEMKEGKAPGNDGLTVSCYKAIWSDVADKMLESFNESLLKGTMATSQRQSIIRLIPKKGKDSATIGNWRPISLMNTDTKIMAKILASRMKQVLEELGGKHHD